MCKLRWASLLLLLLPMAQVQGQGWRKESPEIVSINDNIYGEVIDHTANHGQDRRIWSRSLWQRRDLYVYLPPGFQRGHKYPVMIWLHGFREDEKVFLHTIVPLLDEAISSGKLPPLIVAAPDGSFIGEPHIKCDGTFFLNSPLGNFADFVLYDVWDFLCHNYPIRSERQAHVIAGLGMGGFAAYNFAIKHREAFGVVIGIAPLLNLRWTNKEGNYYADFDPRDWGWRGEWPTSVRPISFTLPLKKPCAMKHYYEPVFGPEPEGLFPMSQENPIEMIDRCRLCPGQLEMFVAYAGLDKYNADAQADSFLYLAAWRGLPVGVAYEEKGTHTIGAVPLFFSRMVDWLTPRLAAYSPLAGNCGSVCAPPAHAADMCQPVGWVPPPLPCCPPQSCGAPKRRLLQPRLKSCGEDPSCHLPPTWLPDAVSQE